MQTHKESRRHHKRHARRPVFPQPSIADIDPADPSQALDESGDFQIEPLAVDAEPSAEAAGELDQAQAESYAASDKEDEDADEMHADEAEATEEPDKDTGELYGVHTPRAADRDLSAGPDHGAMVDDDDGENWLEALEAHSAEMGPEVEHEIVVLDDSDPHEGPPPTDFRDRPKADKGSGGRGGL